jgi:hypothetical protein
MKAMGSHDRLLYKQNGVKSVNSLKMTQILKTLDEI